MSAPQSYQTFYDISRFTLWADAPSTEDNGKRAMLKLSFRDGNPRFVVNTGTPGRDGMINFPMDVPHFVGIINMLKDIANGPVSNQINIDSLAPVYQDNRMTQEKTVVGVLHIGKTAAGVVYISVTAENRPKIIFPIRASKFHVFRDQAKQVLGEDVVSRQMALGIADALLNMVSAFMLEYTRDEYTHSERKPYATGVRGETSAAKAQPARMATGFEDLDSIAL